MKQFGVSALGSFPNQNYSTPELKATLMPDFRQAAGGGAKTLFIKEKEVQNLISGARRFTRK